MPAEAVQTQVSPAVRAAVLDLVYRLADDSVVLGHRNSEWTGLGPILEEDIAFSSMAQDKMGHAQALFTLLHELGEPEPDANAFLRTTEQYRCCELVALPRGDWAFSLVRQFHFAEADRIRFELLSTSSYTPLAHLARKLHGELKYHVMHGRMWMTRFGKGTAEGRERIQAAINVAYPYALGLFEPTSQDEAIASNGIGPSESTVREQWQGEVEKVLGEAGLTLPKNAKPVFGGRIGRHGKDLADMLESMQRVYRIDPNAKW